MLFSVLCAFLESQWGFLSLCSTPLKIEILLMIFSIILGYMSSVLVFLNMWLFWTSLLYCCGLVKWPKGGQFSFLTMKIFEKLNFASMVFACANQWLNSKYVCHKALIFSFNVLIKSQRRNLMRHLVHCIRDRLIHFHWGRSPYFILSFARQ